MPRETNEKLSTVHKEERARLIPKIKRRDAPPAAVMGPVAMARLLSAYGFFISINAAAYVPLDWESGQIIFQ